MPAMPTVIAERIGWEPGMTVLKERVREMWPVCLLPDPASLSTASPRWLTLGCRRPIACAPRQRPKFSRHRQRADGWPAEMPPEAQPRLPG